MMIICREGNHWVVCHAGRVIDEKFPDRESAESWADCNIDDQMFDSQNTFFPPLKYRDAPLMRIVGTDPEPRGLRLYRCGMSTRNMEANVSDELIEAMARLIDPRAWAEYVRLIGRADDWALRGKPGGVDFEKMYRSQAVEAVSDSLSRARALIPIIRAHLEPTSEMLAIGNEAVDTCTKVDPCDNPAKHIWADMLAASPIGGENER